MRKLAVRRWAERGDTIVEVLMAVAVSSLVLVVAYAAVNKDSLANQDAQEHSQALQLAQSQVEFLHSISLGSNNCFSSTGTPVGTIADNTPCMVTADGSKNTSHIQPEYTLAITQPAAGTYKVNVSWPSLTGGGQNNVYLYYQP